MRLFEDVLKTVLNEDRVTKNRSSARKFMRREGFTHEGALDFEKQLKAEYPSIVDLDCKFLLGLARMNLDMELESSEAKRNMNNFLAYAFEHSKDEDINGLSMDLNGLSYHELMDIYGDRIKEFADDAASTLEQEGNSLNPTESRYYVVKIPDFDTANLFSEYVDWCITRDEYAYDHYTNNKLGMFYFCIIKPEFVMNEGVVIQGDNDSINTQSSDNNSIYTSPDTDFDYLSNIPREVGEGCPLDKYGLSMIAISVTEDGSPNTTTCRWNFENGGDNNVISPIDIQQLTHFSYQNVFRVRYTKEELERVKQQQFNEFLEAIKNGDADFKDSTPNDKLNVYKYDNRYLVVDENENPIINEFFNDYRISKEGNMVIVRKQEKENFLLSNGSYLWDQWVDDCEPFKGGYAEVRIGKKWTFMDKQGKLFNNEKYQRISNYFEDGYAIVENDDGKENYLMKDNTYLLKVWADECRLFIDGYASIRINNKFTVIDSKGNRINNEWYDWVYNEFIDGYAIVNKYDYKQNYLLKDGSHLLKVWADECDFFNGDFAIIEKYGKKYKINRQGEIVNNESFNHNDVTNLLTENIIRVIFN